jgi:hypothetical protein
LSSNVTFESFYYKQYEWIVMLSVLIVLSWWHWGDICEETAVSSNKWSTQEVSTGSEHRLWWAAAIEVSEILIRSNVTWKFKIREPHLVYKHISKGHVARITEFHSHWARDFSPSHSFLSNV